jgi:diguanylate cyclase (GGDEF)-like protein
LWIAHARGIDVFDATTAQPIEQLRHRAVDPLSLANAEVRDLLIDRAGWVWAGTFGGGLQRINPRPPGLQSRRFDPLQDAPLTQLSALTLSAAADGGLWVGVAQNGVVRMAPDLSIREFLRSDDPAQGELSGQQPSGLVEAADGTLWVATERGLYRRALGASSFELVSGPDFLEGAAVRRLWAGSAGELWIATGDGLFRRAADGRVKRLANSSGQRVGGPINALALQPDGGWVGGSAGLFRLDAERAALIPVEREVAGQPLRADVLGLLVDRQGQLWVDADGLHRVVDDLGSRVRLDAISARHGFVDVAFGANLLDDSDGRIWSHRFMYDPQGDALHRLGRAEGANAGTGWFRAFAPLPDGRLVFGATEGLLVINPDRFEPWTFEPPLVFTELRVDGEPRPLGPLADSLQLRPGERSFALEFAALDFSAPELLQYRYRVEGRDTDWVEVDADSRVANVGGLWPGDYRLQVQGSNRSGRFSSQTLELPVRVLPLWWQTPLAMVLGLLLLIGLTAVLVVWRERRLQWAKSRLEADVQARTRDLRALSAELQRKNHDFEEASLTDPLTGLRNRRFAMQEMPKEVALCLRRIEAREPAAAGHNDLVLFLIDFDHFKLINDRYGHAGGDAVLCQFAERLRGVFRSSDHLVRWGGEEFLVVARDSDREHAADLAERLRSHMATAPFVLEDGSQVLCTVCIGFAPFPLLAELPLSADWEELVDLADHLLYAAKRSGRNAWIGLFPERADALPERSSDWCEPAMVRSGASRLLSNLPEGRVLAALGETTERVALGA